LRLPHRQDGALDFGLDVWALFHGNVSDADIAA
jgi:hypothetical protein